MHRVDNSHKCRVWLVAQTLLLMDRPRHTNEGAVVANVSVFFGRHAQLDCDACFGGRFRIVEVYLSAGTRGQLILSNRFQRTKAIEGSID